MLWVVSLSVLFTWIYDNAVGSLLIAILLHASVNFSAAILIVLPASEVGYAPPFLLITLLGCMLAASILLLAGPISPADSAPNN